MLRKICFLTVFISTAFAAADCRADMAAKSYVDTKAADSVVVHKTGAETVAGEKTFTTIPKIPTASLPAPI
ncbi:MAG: hypothetical protein LBJ18_01180 [Rickettsiales bacterium]|jgi:hypothetical protein|nr:hypothetical protein [Rickettsiales bacterium]